MNEQIKAQIKAHALRESPNECCGIVAINGFGEVKVFECENLARNKVGRFAIDPKKNIEAEKFGHIVCFYHSHASEFLNPDNDKFSKEDIDISYESCIPALLYVHPQDTWHYSQPSTYVPRALLGRAFVWGIWDCYSLVKDYFKINKKISMGHYFPPENASPSSNFGYEALVNNENFHEVPVEEMKKDDVILFKIKSEFINHSAVYLGGNEFLHQPINRISSTGLLDDRYLKYIAKVMRLND